KKALSPGVLKSFCHRWRTLDVKIKKRFLMFLFTVFKHNDCTDLYNIWYSSIITEIRMILSGFYSFWVLTILCVILIAANLRAPLTSVCSLIPFIRDDLMISNALAGTLTTVPLLVFGFL